MTHVTLQHLPNDPICLRASIGGDEKRGYYCTFRGNQQEVIAMIETVLLVLQNAPQLEIEPDAF
jgi:hypothetical protein